MIFTPEIAAKVVDGTKSMTRRRLSVRYRADRWYKVQPGRGKFHVCHIFLTKVRTERLGQIGPASAKAEGFRNTDQFLSYWERLYGSVNLRERVAVIEWVVLPAVKECCAKLEGLR